MRETTETEVANAINERKHDVDNLSVVENNRIKIEEQASATKLNKMKKNKDEWDGQTIETKRKSIVENEYDLDDNKPFYRHTPLIE